MPIQSSVARQATSQVDRQLARTVGVSPGKGEMVLKENQATHQPGWFLWYPQWNKLGPTASGPAQPVQHKSEDERQLALDWIGAGMIAVSLAAALLGYWPLAGVTFFAGAAAVGFHIGARTMRLIGRRPPLPVFTVLPPKGAPVHPHRLAENVEIELRQAERGSGTVLEEKLIRSGGQLEIAVRQRDRKLDGRRRDIYSRRFGSIRDRDVSLGYIGFDRPPAVTWQLPGDRDRPGSGLVKLSPRVLQLRSPVQSAERSPLFGKGDDPNKPWGYSAVFEPSDPLAICPSVSAAAMIDPDSAGNTLRFTISRAVADRSPKTRVRVAGLAGEVRLAASGDFRRPNVELHHGGHEDSARGLGMLSTEDDPQTHSPKFSLSFSDNEDFLPGDCVTVFLVFEKPIRPQKDDMIRFVVLFDFLDPVAGFHELALFDPLGYPALDRDPATAGTATARPAFAKPAQQTSRLTVQGGLSLEGLRVTGEETLKAGEVHIGRLPDAGLLHELIDMLATDHRLAIRDVREDFAERSGPDRGALAWTILAKGSDDMLSPDIMLRIAGTRPTAGGSEATSVEISLIARYADTKQYEAASQLGSAIKAGTDAIVKAFIARRSADEAMASSDRGATFPSMQADGDLGQRLEVVVARAEHIIERFERIFSPT